MACRSTIADDTAAVEAWQKAKEPEKTRLLNELFRAKAGLIRQLTQKAARAEKTSEDIEDLLQAGAIGFLKTLERFRPELGWSLSTYAAWWIRHEVQRVARRANIIALPRIRLTNVERAKVIEALHEEPEIEPEQLDVRRSQFEQVRTSFGLRYISDDTTRGARAIEKKSLDNADAVDGEEMLDEAHRYRVMQNLVARIRAGATADQAGVSPEVYELALEVIRADDEDAMTEEKTPNPKDRKSANQAARARLAERLLDKERAKIRAWLARLDDKTIEQMLASHAG